MAEVQIEERVASLEIQVKDIAKQESKIDKLMDLVNEVKNSLSNNFMQKSDCNVKCAVCDAKFAEAKVGRRRLFWAAVTATMAFILFLLQQLLNIHVKVGG